MKMSSPMAHAVQSNAALAGTMMTQPGANFVTIKEYSAPRLDVPETMYTAPQEFAPKLAMNSPRKYVPTTVNATRVNKYFHRSQNCVAELGDGHSIF